MIEWVVKSFNDLTRDELYGLLRLRNEVFIVEQKVLRQDADEKDFVCHHLLGLDGGVIVAYCRLLPKGVNFDDEPSFGRVCVALSHRKCGYGKQMMHRALEECSKLFGPHMLRIEIHIDTEAFYVALGFVRGSDVYEKYGGEPHLNMVYTPPRALS